MNYVLQLRFIADNNAVPYQDFTPYYVYDPGDGETWQEVYDPRIADIFDRKKDAIKWAKENTTFIDHMSVVKMSDAIDDFEKWMEGGMVRRVLPLVDYSISRPYNGEDKYEILEWWWKFTTKTDDFSIRHEDYETWPELFMVFNHLWEFRAFIDNYNKCYRYGVQISVQQDSDFETFKEELDLVLPRLEPYRDTKSGELSFDIFDHYLSEGGNSVYLISQNDGQWRLDRRFGTTLGPTSLQKCFEYMCKYRYYE